MTKIINNVFRLSVILTLIMAFFWLGSYYHKTGTYNDITFLNLIVLFSYYLVTIVIVRYGNYQNKGVIIIIGTIYIFFFASIYLSIFHFYNGDFFDFQRSDTITYYNLIDRFQSLSLSRYITTLSDIYGWDDMGAPVYAWIMYKIIPSPLFIYFSNITISFFAALMLYKLSNLFIDQKESLVATFLFIFSSYFIYFHVSLFKETLFVFLCISAVYLGQKLIVKFTLKRVLSFLFTLLLLSFFRIGTPIIILFSYFVYYVLFRNKFHIRNVFILVLFTPLVLYILYPIFSSTYGHIMDAEFLTYYVETSGYNYSLPIQISLSLFNAIFGPIPTFIAVKGHEISSFYYAGYLIKYLLGPIFFLSTISIFKNKIANAYPLIIYYGMGSIIFGIALRGFDIRFLVTHSFLFYLIVFVGIKYCNFKSIRVKLFLFLFYTMLIIVFFMYNSRL